MVDDITDCKQQCETFGSAGPWSDGKESSDGNYAFNYSIEF